MLPGFENLTWRKALISAGTHLATLSGGILIAKGVYHDSPTYLVVGIIAAGVAYFASLHEKLGR